MLASSEGAMRFALAADSAITADDTASIKIYKENDDTGEYELVRRYTNANDVPDQLALLAGKYKASVQVGERIVVSFDEKCYYGEKFFTITAGEVEPVEVKCDLLSTIVRVNYDASIVEHFAEGYSTTVAIDNEFNEAEIASGDVYSLNYVETKEGYFLMPEGQTTLAWQFTGVNEAEAGNTAPDGTVLEGGKITAGGLIENVKASARYTINLKYSPDAPGNLIITADVIEGTEDLDENISFSPDPTIMGNGFGLEEVQLSSSTLTFSLAALADISKVTLTAGGVVYDVMGGNVAGTTLTKTSTEDATAYSLTIAPAFFANVAGGNQIVKIVVEDEDHGKKEADITYIVQGLHPMKSYTIWGGYIDIAGTVLDASAAAKLMYRANGGEWTELTASNNEGLVEGRLIFTENTTYEYKMVVGEAEYVEATSIQTPVGVQLPNGGFEEWSNDTTPGGLWSSGNNSFTTLMSRKEGGHSGSYYAELKAKSAVGKFAAGNLFTGSFELNISTMSGKVTFGKDFTYNLPPKSVSFWMKNNQGQINYGNKASGTDPYSAMVLITDGTTYTVDTTNEASFLTKDNLKDQPGIIAYGFLSDTDSNADWTKKTVVLTYVDGYEKKTPTKISVSFATSAYGDYFCGSTDSWVCVDDVVINY